MKPLFFCCLTILLFSACGPINGKKCEGNSVMSFRFEIPISIYPVADTMHIGDTLWIESTYDRFLLNLENQKHYDVGEIDFKIMNDIMDLSTSPVVGISNAHILEVTGKTEAISFYGTRLVHEYNLIGDKFYIKYAWVLDRTGAFQLSFSDNNNYRTFKYTGQHITECPDEYVSLLYNSNSNAENGYYIYRNAADTNFNKLDKSMYDQGGLYSFYVKP